MTNLHIIRNIKPINKVFLLLQDSIPSTLVEKYYVDYYVKDLYTIDLLKISVIYFYSKEKCLKHFLKSLFKSKNLCKIFNLPIVSVQQVFKALKKRCWLFFQEVFLLIYEKLILDTPKNFKRFFRKKEIKILDSSFLKCPISRSYLS